MIDTPDKGPVRFLEKQIKKYDRINNLESMAVQTPNIYKWIGNADIDKELSMNSGTTPLLRTNKNHVLSNFTPEPTWTKPANKHSLIYKDSPP